MSAESVSIHVTWDTDGEPVPTENPVSIPVDVYEDGMTSWNDVVADWLSDKYGYLVTDWVLET